MEESKFYVPVIEEFHVGFEYETIHGNSYWVKEISDGSEIYHISKYYLPKGEIRVKYLDREDIESLDWTLDSEEDGRMIFTHKYLPYIRLFASIQEYSTDRHVTISSDTSILFTGNIKNKSRLRSIMNWTGTLVEKFEGTNEITNI